MLLNLRQALRNFGLIKSYEDPAKVVPIHLGTPSPHIGRLIVTGLGSAGFRGWGKGRPDLFFPPFAYELYIHGIETIFVTTLEDLYSAASFEPHVVVHIYSEEVPRDDLIPLSADLSSASRIYNPRHIGAVIGDKIQTNRILSGGGVPMPRHISDPSSTHARDVFSTSPIGTQQAATIIEPGDPLGPDKYNVEFIDTRIPYNNVDYYTTVRLMCIGGEIVHAYVRAKAAHVDDPSVHGSDTPLDPPLLEYLHATLVHDIWPELKQLALTLAGTLGPGFYAHDLLVEQPDGHLYVCEVGFKYMGGAFVEHILPIGAHLPSFRVLLGPEYGQLAAHAFLRDCRSAGVFE